MCRSSLIGLPVCALIAFATASSEAQSQNVSRAINPEQAPAASAMPLPAPIYPAVAPSAPANPASIPPPAQYAPYASTSAPPYVTASAAPVTHMASPATTAYPNTGVPTSAATSTTSAANSSSAPKPQLTNWSLGAGIVYAPGDGNLNSLGSSLMVDSGSREPTIRSSVFMERRLWNSIYLLLQPDFGYTKYHHASPSSMYSSLIDTSTTLGLSAGLRWVANPGGTVEIGMAHLVDFDWTRRTGSVQQDYETTAGAQSIRTRAELNAYDIGLSTGIVAEYQLLSALWLRINVPFLRVAYVKASLKEKDLGGVVLTESNFGATLYAAPRLELRLTW